MAVLVAAIAGALVGALAGAAVTAWWYTRSRTGQPAAAAAGAETPVRPAAPEPAQPSGGEPDPDLKPVFEATRDVVTALEQRYQGARAESTEPKRAPRAKPRRRP